ncbi:ammonium transporter [Laribacter hongkongensis]|uniref:ammonium transporter n=1 Tax=Laribacter hongkongensis TaxID=168471 RepID=UPI001EFE9198|nr:ammonium transporter [Laribacter hongkongensis]MCG9081297.1 ammonium transporter [Laribacter hongkongensis]
MLAINTGDTAFIILCTALVALMTPGLALFYGGLVRSRDMLTIMMQNFISMGIVTLVWVLGGFSLAFGKDIAGLIGDFRYFAMIGIGMAPHPTYAPSIPFIMVFAYQMMFAIITPALITGAFAGRFRFSSYLWFIALWTLVVYIPVAHWIWGGGFLGKLGVIDFAGGIVVHTTAGFAALATAIFLGRRTLSPNDPPRPANIPLVAVGTGLLWFGWFGFNAGGAYAANQLAAYAFVNTAIAGGIAMVVWLFWSAIFEDKPSFSGVMVGGVAGLATITPTAGYIEPWAAIIVGALGATICYFAKGIQEKFKYDDALEVFRAHGIGGITGSLLVGFFAERVIDGVSGGWEQFFIQLLGVAVVAIYSFVVTWILMMVLHKPRVSPEQEREGLDKSEFGEEAYYFDKN